MKILIVGFGRLGKKILELADSNMEFIGIKRNPIHISNPKVNILYIDLLEHDFTFLQEYKFDYIIYCPTPDHFTEQDYQNIYLISLENIINNINVESLKRFIFISSTSVYEQNDGEEVNELSLTIPQKFSGKIMLSAERLLQVMVPQSTVIRFGGIYGDTLTNRLIEAVKNNTLHQIGNLDSYSNRIHIDDCAGMILFLIKKNQEIPIHSIYIGVDTYPCLLREVIEWLSKQLKVDFQIDNTISYNKQRSTNKRCNSKNISLEGFLFKYPSYKEGYLNILRDMLGN